MAKKKAAAKQGEKTARATGAEDQITGFLLGGKEVKSGETFAVLSPWDRSVVATVSTALFEDALGAVDTSVRHAQAIRAIPAYERQRILNSVASRLVYDRSGFAATIVAEAGKPLRAALAEVDRAAFTFRIAAEEAVRQGGE